MATEHATPAAYRETGAGQCGDKYVALRHPRAVSRQVLRWLIELPLWQYAHETVETTDFSRSERRGITYKVRRKMKTLLVNGVLLPPWRRSCQPCPPQGWHSGK